MARRQTSGNLAFPFDVYRASARDLGTIDFSKAIREGPITWFAFSTSALVTNGKYVGSPNLTGATQCMGGFGYVEGSGAVFADGGPPGASDWGAGDILEAWGVLRIPSFSDLGANQLQGLNFIAGNSNDGGEHNKTGVVQKFGIGVDSAGDVFILTATGSAVTVTDTTANYTADEEVFFYLKFTKGTGVDYILHGATFGGFEGTVATNLPGRVNRASLGKGTTTAARQVWCRGAWYRFTPAS